MNAIEVAHNPEAQRFECRLDGHLAVAEYEREPGRIRFTHTRVPEALAGQGVGGRLARAGLESARAEGLEVIPLCSFIAGYIRKHPEYRPLVHADYRATVGE